MENRNHTFIQKTIHDISKNVKDCSNSIKKCCEITCQKMHYNLTNTKIKKYKYRNLNQDYSSIYYENDDDEFDYNLDLSIIDRNNMFVYDGIRTVWFSRRNALLFSSIKENTINLLKAKVGYTLISRSFVKRNILYKECYNIDGERIKNNSNIEVGTVLQCRLNGWKNYCLCSVIRVNYTERLLLLDLSFPSCPESEIVLAWHFNSSIEANKTLIKYRLPENYNIKKRLSPIIEEKKEEVEPLYNSVAAFLINEEKNEIISSNTTGNPKEEIDDSDKIYSANFIRNSNNNQLLKYNVFWVYKNDYNNKIFKRKQVVISSYNHVNNIYTDSLSNVKIINDYHMKNILSIHQRSYNTLKILRANKQQKLLNMVEPQTLDFFKYNKNRSRIASALASGLICTYTGPLSRKAKEYLFKIY
tara:strand:+ start:21799 stop:23046 length:1248 start_codon:yes stop_codon:yes gene_type:complete